MSSRAALVSVLFLSLLAGVPANASEDIPARKPGLWQRTMQTLRLAPREQNRAPHASPQVQPVQHSSDPNTPGLWRRTLQTFRLAPRQPKRPEPAPSAAPASSARTVRVKDLMLKLDLSPMPLQLSETRQLKVSLTVSNRSRRYVHLDFPTTQRIEVLVRDDAGKVVTQWSEDQAFSNEPITLTINPGERVEYNASVSTRDMRPGRAYTVEGFFPNYDRLKIQQTVVPQK